MIDLGFLTEAEQEAILKVLHRDAELKKAEEQRVRHLQNVVDDENELKYKSGQWFYEAKSKRHNDKIHGADLVRASIRKRKKPSTIELYGVMEMPDEDEDLQPDKVETNHSSKKVSFQSPGTDKGILKNGTASPAKQRKNPFNSGELEDERDLDNVTPDPNALAVQVNGQEETKPDIISSIVKYGVKLPYPELTESRRISQKAEDGRLPKHDVQHPVPKPRTFYMNGQGPQRSNSPLNREDSINGTSRRGILKRRSSSSSTDSESIRIPHNVEPNKIVLPGSPILEAAQNDLFDEEATISEGSVDRLKQVRFSEHVLQKPPSPKPEPYLVRETDEFGILEPVHPNDLDGEFVDRHTSEESVPVLYPRSVDDYNDSLEILGQNALLENPRIPVSIQSSSSTISSFDPDEGISLDKEQTILEETHTNPELSIDSIDTEPVYAVVSKAPQADLDQAEEFDMDDALTEPRFLGHGVKNQNTYHREKPLVFGKSYGGGGKMSFEPRSPTRKPEESYIFPREQVLAPERAAKIESPYHDLEDEPMTTPQRDDNGLESVAAWRRPFKEPLKPRSIDITELPKTTTRTMQIVPKVDFKDEDTLANTYPENWPNSKYSPGVNKGETKYESAYARNTRNVKDRPVTSPFPVAQNMSPTYTPGSVQTHEILLRENKGRADLPKSANFKVMSLKERINEMPWQQMSNPSQFQNLKHFWNVEEKNQPVDEVDTPPNKILTDVLNRNKPTRADLKQRNSKEIPADDLILPDTLESLSEEEQTSQKVASWLAQTPTVYGDEQMDRSQEQLYPRGEVIENVKKSSANKKLNAEDFTSALQKLREEASEALDDTETEKLRTEKIKNLPREEPDHTTKTTTISAVSLNSMEKMLPAAGIKTTNRGFYEQVINRSQTSYPAKETNTVAWNLPTMHSSTSERNAGELVEERVQKTVAPAKEESAFKIGFEKLQAEYESLPAKPHEYYQTEESNLPNEELSEEEAYELPEEVLEKSTVPKSRDQQDFISSLKKLEIEASTPPLLLTDVTENQVDPLEEEMTRNTVSPVKSSNKIGFGQIISTDDSGQLESPIEHSLAYQAQRYYSPNNEHSVKVANEFEETVEKTTVTNTKAENELCSALKKLELEALSMDENVSNVEQEICLEKPKINSSLQSKRSIVQTIDINPSKFLSHTEEEQSDLQFPYSSRGGRFVEEVEEPPKEDSYMFKPILNREQLKYTFNGQENLPVDENETIERTIVETQENSADFNNRLLRLQEEAEPIYEEPEDLSISDTVRVSPLPNRKVISKKVFPTIESITTSIDDTNDGEEMNEVLSDEPSPWSKPKDTNEQSSSVYSRLDELEKPPLYSSSDQSGFYKETRNVLYKKPEKTTEVSNSKQGMEDTNPILSALKRSTDKTLNSKAVQEVSPTSTNEVKLESPKEDALAPTPNSFPENAEKLKRLSQSVPAFLQDDTDGRETDSASESSFQIGRHKKSPSSLTNLSGSSGMASMSSVSGSVMSMYSGDFGNIDVKGEIEVSIDYVEQLKELLIYIYQCKDLSVADAKKQRSDPYVKAYLLPEKSKMGKRKTAVKKKTLNPVYNEILRYKIPKQSLVTQTLNLSVWHRDVLGRNSFLGEVNLNLEKWDWSSKQRNWYPLEPRTPAAGIGLENRGEIKLSLQYIPHSPTGTGAKPATTGEVHIWIKECLQLPMLRENKINSFVKCTILPDTSRKSRQKTRTVDKTPNPIFNHTMVYDGFKEEDLREACVELTVWDHNKLSNHFIGGLRLGLGTGKSYGTAVDWMDSSHEESTMWERMITSPNTWIEGMLPLRMFKMAKLAK
ncbi:synaptotagmin-like protein 2 isoform X2 [Mixophyes fleayi]|uniref:synaptotagmin-like protein 2 isoform X2 n=1 Tax=Mixophyes fleayi TaxID=3061075 RepID=UPI003F4E3E83